MKIVAKNGTYLKVSNSDAEIKVKSGWKYTPKSEWKKNVRDIKKT